MIKKTIVDKIVVGTPMAKTVDVGVDSSDVVNIVNTIFESPVTLTDLETTQSVIFNDLPVTDPLNAGQLWRDSSMGSVLRISTGIPIEIDVITI